MKHKIVIIDDDENIVKLYARYLNDLGFTIITSTDSTEALEIIHRELPDVIISDIMMPNIDGYKLAERVRTNIKTAQIPILFISTLSGVLNIRKAMDAGIDDYLIKPVNKKSLIKAIEARLQRKVQCEQWYSHSLQYLKYHLTTFLPHELRTPLTGIMGWLGFLSSSLDTLNKQEIFDALDSMQYSVARLSKVVEYMLLYSELGLKLHDPVLQKKEQFFYTENAGSSIKEILYQTVDDRGRLDDLVLTETGFNEYSSSDTLAIASKYLFALVTQIAENACKYSPEGTPVICQISYTDSHLHLYIEDRGRGMSQEHLRSIEAFTQFDREFYEQQGIGIGLALAAKIINLVHGTLTIESTIGVGTKVGVVIPIYQKTEQYYGQVLPEVEQDLVEL